MSNRLTGLPMTSPAPVTTPTQADNLAEHFIAVMKALVELVQQETELMRVGSLPRPRNSRRQRPTSPVSMSPTRCNCGRATAISRSE
jgi:hypothetical protein